MKKESVIGSKVYYLNTPVICYDESSEVEFGLFKRLQEPDTIPTGYRTLCKQVIEDHKETTFYEKFISTCCSAKVHSVTISQKSTDSFPVVRYLLDESEYTNMCKASDKIDAVIKLLTT